MSPTYFTRTGRCAWHDVWKRDFTGSCGLFSIVLREMTDHAFDTFLNGFELLKFGFSWGGYESLLNPADGHVNRQYGPWSNGSRPGRLLRIHVGLEDIGDILTDFERAFSRI